MEDLDATVIGNDIHLELNLPASLDHFCRGGNVLTKDSEMAYD